MLKYNFTFFNILVNPISLSQKSKSRLRRLETFTNGTHNDTWMSPGYYEAWMRFIPEVTSLIEEEYCEYLIIASTYKPQIVI